MGGHENKLSDFRAQRFAIDRDFNLPLEHLYQGIKRGGMLAEPQPFVKCEHCNIPCVAADQDSTDNGSFLVADQLQ